MGSRRDDGMGLLCAIQRRCRAPIQIAMAIMATFSVNVGQVRIVDIETLAFQQVERLEPVRARVTGCHQPVDRSGPRPRRDGFRLGGGAHHVLPSADVSPNETDRPGRPFIAEIVRSACQAPGVRWATPSGRSSGCELDHRNSRHGSDNLATRLKQVRNIGVRSGLS